MTKQQRSDDDDKKKKSKKQGVTVRYGGPESAGATVEHSSVPTGLSSELLAPLERSQENVDKRHSEKRTTPTNSTKSKQIKRLLRKKDNLLKDSKVYGFRIPPKLAHHPEKVAKLKKKGDANKGISALYIFLDRLFRMKPVS